MVAADALDSERVIYARLKQCQMRAPKAKQHAGRKELGPVVARVDGEPCGELGGTLLLNRRIELCEERTATNEIHGTPIIGIDKAEVPELRSLVEIGHTGRANLQRHVRKRIIKSISRDAFLERDKGIPERGVLRRERELHEARH